VPLKDDGLYRSDGVSGVIRPTLRAPVALGDHLDRLERRSLDLPVDRLALERDRRLAEFSQDDGQLRIAITRGGRRSRSRAAPSAPRPSAWRPSPCPQVILTGQVALRRGQMQATQAAEPGRRRPSWRPRRHGAGGTDSTVCSLRRRRAAHPSLDSGSAVDHAPASSPGWTSMGHLATCVRPRRHSSPRAPARCKSLASTPICPDSRSARERSEGLRHGLRRTAS
jgi:hypothetical protein